MADVLSKIADAADAGKALDEFSPPHAEYKKLKAALAEMRGKAGGASKEIGDGPQLKLSAGKAPPMEDPRVPLLREKRGLPVSGDPPDPQYDAKVGEAVKKFQRGHELPVTGSLDAKTIK